MIYKEKILLLHKNKAISDRISDYLREVDYAVFTTVFNQDAYNLARTVKPDLILWGEILNAEAKEILRRLKRSKYFKNTPVIVLVKDLELFDRIELEKHGITDIIPFDPNLTELRLKIKFHLNYVSKEIEYEKDITRLKNISELQYNLTIVNDLQRLCELLDDFILNDYPVDFIITLVFNKKTNVWDYKSYHASDPKSELHNQSFFELPAWKEYFFTEHLAAERISNKKIHNFFETIGLNSEIYYQLPLQAFKKQQGIILIGTSLKNTISEDDFKTLSILLNSAGHRIFELRRFSGSANGYKKPEIQTLIQRFNEDEIFKYLAKEVLKKLETNICIYFSYNPGFRFLYPQYCFEKESDINLFEYEKPPVLLTKEYPTFERFIQSKRKSAVFNFSKNKADDLAAISQLAGGKYNIIIIFAVVIADEVKGFLVTADENSMKRFSSKMIQDAELLVKNATDVLEEGRLVKQAQQTIKQLDRVFELGKELTLEHHINELLPKIAMAIRRTLGWNIVILDRKDQHSENYENICYFGIKEKVYKGIREKYSNSMYAQLKEKAFVQSNSYFLDHKCVQNKIDDGDIRNFQMQIGKEWNDRDWLFIPIQSRGKELGVISVNDPVDRLRPNDEKVRSLEYFANQAAVALDNAKLFQDLKASETKYRMLAETITMGLITCDQNGSILYDNKSFAGLLKYSNADSLLGHNLFNLISDKQKKQFEKYVLEVMKGVYSEKYEDGLEIELMGNDNKYVPLKIYLAPNTNGKTEGDSFTAVLADLRAQKRIERLKADFNSMIVHDLRSPLNIIQGYIDIVRNGVVGEISEEQEELLSVAKENCYKVLKLIDNFLTASKLEVGTFDVKPEINSLPALIESVHQNHKVLAEKKNIVLNKIIDKNFPRIEFDKMRIEQVLTNYISNALKFTKYGGNIEIGSKIIEKDNELTGKKSQEIWVWVKDNGVGIAKTELDKVFNKYEQTEAGKDSSLKGTGLGLAICKEIITLHQGQVWVESKEGEGSTFYFSLPITKN